jgi:hypothetical protein
VSKIVQTPEQILEKIEELIEDNKYNYGPARDLAYDLDRLVYEVENGYPAT